MNKCLKKLNTKDLHLQIKMSDYFIQRIALTAQGDSIT